MMHRFTLDGDAGLERRLFRLCRDIGAFLEQRIPAGQLEAVVLGGGYGRGEGGVARSPGGDLPYNDLEFYIFLTGHPAWQERRHRAALKETVERFEPGSGLHVEFKVESLDRFRGRPPTMFSYDLVAGHYIVLGPERFFEGCEAHLRPDELPLSEATRLLFNRCSGLLLSAQRLQGEQFSSEDHEFVWRNLAKAKLAFGDVVLTAHGLYHWSCRERHRRLLTAAFEEGAPHLEEIRELHREGVDFKLHPSNPRVPDGRLREDHRRLAAVGRDLWLWIEQRRLRCAFPSASAYAMSPVPKCPEQSAWRSRLAHLRRLGPAALCRPGAARYPRERLFHALNLLLWEPATLQVPEWRSRVQHQLTDGADSFDELVAAYESWRAHYG